MTKNKIIKNNLKLFLLIIFFFGVLLIISAYAWFSSSINVQVKFFDLVVSTDNGLFISLDGVEFSDSIEISQKILIVDLADTYPTNTSQWAANGLWPVSSAGISSANSGHFDMYFGNVTKVLKNKGNRRYLATSLIKEDKSSSYNSYIAFDVFLKNVSDSPYSDNLYLDQDTYVDFAENSDEETKETLESLINSIRFGFVNYGTLPLNATVEEMQKKDCNGNCQMLIYEPNSLSHSEDSIAELAERGIILEDGVYNPTYAIISEGTYLIYENGQIGSGYDLDEAHFKLQKTITDDKIDEPIFDLPAAITKIRVYLWIEGQDMDSIEATSKGASLYLSLNFVKDLAGLD